MFQYIKPIDDGLQVIANKIPEVKHVSVFSINSMLTQLRT